LDLLDLYRGRISPRKAAVLAVKLPPASATWAEYGGPLAWSGETHFIVKAIDELRVANWQRTKDGSKGSNPPKRIEPPKPAAEARRQSSKIEARAAAFKRRQQRRNQTE
jgi:hypothetical protein